MFRCLKCWVVKRYLIVAGVAHDERVEMSGSQLVVALGHIYRLSLQIEHVYIYGEIAGNSYQAIATRQ